MTTKFKYNLIKYIIVIYKQPLIMLACRLLQRKSDEKVITEFKKNRSRNWCHTQD